MRRRAALVTALCSACTLPVTVGGECRRGDARCDVTALAVAPVAQAAPPAPLEVFIARAGSVVRQIDLGCTDRCAIVSVHAQGGVDPYAYLWSDGATGMTRELCPTETTDYGVVVQDAAVPRAGEGPARTATATVTVSPAQCPTPDPTPAPTPAPAPGPVPDAGVTADPLGAAADDGPLTNCTTIAFREPRRLMPTAACGSPVWMTLERQLHAGQRHELRAYGRGLFVGRWRIELWGSDDGCTRDESLGEFRVEQGQVDVRLQFQPLHAHPMIVLSAVEEVDSERWVPYLGYSVCD